MILEVAMLQVRVGQEPSFEEAFRRASTFIASRPGCRSVALHRCLEAPTKYLLLVDWDRLEDHTEGFRRSPQYQEWAALLHHFYDPFPTVEHFSAVALPEASPSDEAGQPTVVAGG